MPKQKHHSATFKAQVVLEMLKEEKTVAQIAAEHQIHPGQLHRWKRQALDNFAHLFTESESVKQQAQAHDQEVTELYAQIGKLTTPSTLSRTERQALLDGGPDALPVTTQTALLSLNRSSLYYRPVGPDPVEVTLKHRIDEIYTSAPFTGRAASPHNCSGKAMPSTASVCSAICTRWGFGALRRGRIRVRPNPGPRSIRTY